MLYKTEQRKRLEKLLKDAPDKTFTVKEISAELSDVSVSSVYRNLAKLVDMGAVRRSVNRTDRESVYQYIGCKCSCPRIHLTCTVCGRMVHVDPRTAAAVEKSVSLTEGFLIDISKTALWGTCKDCAAKS